LRYETDQRPEALKAVGSQKVFIRRNDIGFWHLFPLRQPGRIGLWRSFGSSANDLFVSSRTEFAWLSPASSG
jgi:hypothetical protein